MTKTVMDGPGVCHVWAQQEQRSARSHNGNVFFEGDTLYSYGRHFPLGRFVANKAGERVVLLNSNSYSITTSKHQSWAWGAVYGLGLPVFRVPGCSADHAANVQSLAEAAGALALSAKRARPENRDYRLADAATAFDAARDYARTFGVKFKAAGLDDLAAEVDAAKKRAAAKVRAELKAQRAREADDFAAWRRGETSYCPSAYRTDDAGGAYLRIIGDELQTSLHARVPLDHAVRAFRFVKLVRQKGEAWQANGRSVRVGHFVVSKISAKGDITAGCHFIRWPEIERAAREAGVVDDRPSDEAAQPSAGA